MIKLLDNPITISYNIDDCKKLSLAELINDIGEEVKTQLTNDIKFKPEKCNIIILYSSYIKDLNGRDDDKSMGQQRQ